MWSCCCFFFRASRPERSGFKSVENRIDRHSWKRAEDPKRLFHMQYDVLFWLTLSIKAAYIGSCWCRYWCHHCLCYHFFWIFVNVDWMQRGTCFVMFVLFLHWQSERREWISVIDTVLCKLGGGASEGEAVSCIPQYLQWRYVAHNLLTMFFHTILVCVFPFCPLFSVFLGISSFLAILHLLNVFILLGVSSFARGRQNYEQKFTFMAALNFFAWSNQNWKPKYPFKSFCNT